MKKNLPTLLDIFLCMTSRVYIISALAFMGLLAATNAHAADIPKDFRGSWCAESADIRGDWAAYPDGTGSCESHTAFITSASLTISKARVSCVARDVTPFDVCPWGMIFKDRDQAKRNRPNQINPWSSGCHIVFICTGADRKTYSVEVEWAIEKGNIVGGANYKCPWAKK